MQILLKRMALMLGLSFIWAFKLAQAGTPLWTFTPLTATVVSVSPTDSATIQYTVTNQSTTAHTLTMTPITGVSQATTGAGACSNPFTLGYQQSCTLSLNVEGAALAGNVVGGPVVCQQGSTLQCYQPEQADQLNITLTSAPSTPVLSVSPSTLALSVNDPTANAQLTGTPRTITVSNVGAVAATGLTITYPTVWPAGTVVSASSCGSTLAPGSSCSLTISPGAGATSNCNSGIAPTPGVIGFSADGTATVQTRVVVLNYGCIYQGGYVYAIDDTTTASGSIGGKTAALTDTVVGSTAVPEPGTNNWGGSGTDVGVSTNENDLKGLMMAALTPRPLLPPWVLHLPWPHRNAALLRSMRMVTLVVRAPVIVIGICHLSVSWWVLAREFRLPVRETVVISNCRE